MVKTDADPGSIGRTPTLGALGDLIESRVNSKEYPLKTNLYIIIGTPDVSVTYGSNYSCNSPQADRANSCFCGIHTWQQKVGANQSEFRYAFITTGLPGCQAQILASPNGNVDADAAVNIIAHEMAESVTDGYQGTFGGGLIREGYNDPRDGSEIADMCNFYFPNIYKVANGSLANIHIGSYDFLIQAL